TDHDTLGGWAEAEAAALGTGIEIVPGVELSTIERGHSLHLLGFYPDVQQLQPSLDRRRASRSRRATAMAAKLADLGYPITLPALDPNVAPGRPHIAKALLDAGHVTSFDEAFDRFLREGRPAYVSYDNFTAIEGIQLLRSCGAVVSWAHPYLFRGGKVEDMLPEFVAAGLQGIEVYHPEHSPRDRRRLLELADTYGLIATGGSDYHGPKPPNDRGKRREVIPLNSLAVPAAWLADLKALRDVNRAKATRGSHQH
ncbi:MAG: PHP domain-containing protein, partial [Prochlorothrix sp.]